MAPLSIGPLSLETAIALFQTLPDFEIALVDRVLQAPSGDIALAPQWVQMGDGTIRDYRLDIYTRAMALSHPSRRGSLFDMSYAALAEQAHTTMWTIDERFYNNARSIGLGFVMQPGLDPLPWRDASPAINCCSVGPRRGRYAWSARRARAWSAWRRRGRSAR